MKKKEFETIICATLPELFSLGHCLIPDECHAGQIVIDAINILFYKKQNMLEEILTSDVDQEGKDNIKLILSTLMAKEILNLAQKRHGHFNEQANYWNKYIKPTYKSFYTLSLQQRTLLFLITHMSFSIEDVAQVLEIDLLKAKSLAISASNFITSCQVNNYLDNGVSLHAG
ncbi:MAG: hypothetical protein ACOCUH_03495 [Bacteriovoracia bacterium]